MNKFIAIIGFTGILAAASGVLFAENAKPARPARAAKAPAVALSSAAVQQAFPQLTLDNLITAYSNGLNTETKYLAYAAKADEEGYKKAGQLFRALAKSEAVQSAVYARAITGLGAEKPAPDIALAEVKTTAENIRAASRVEEKEYETVYTQFLTQAIKDDVKLGMVAFGGAIKNKTKHKFLYQTILNNTDAWQAASPTGFYVCKRCGNTVADLFFERCPNCRVPVSWYLQVE